MNVDVFDLGFLYVKSIINGTPVKIKSVVGEGKNLQFRDMNMDTDEDDYSCKLNNKEYFVSDLAIKQSDSVMHSLKPDRFDSASAQVLLSTVLGIGYKGKSTATRFVTGLPVSHYSAYKKDLYNLMMSQEHEYDICERGKDKYSGIISPVDTLIIPQPFGAAMDLLLDDNGRIRDKKLASKTIAIIDIGFGTTDVYVMESLSTIEKMTFSSNTAINHSYSLIADKLQDKFSVLYPLYKIEGVVQSGKLKKYGKVYSMDKTSKSAFKSSAQQLVAEIYNKWRNIQDIDEVFVTGGGGARMYEFMEEEFPNIQLVDNCQWSVANGCRKWGIRSWSNNG